MKASFVWVAVALTTVLAAGCGSSNNSSGPPASCGKVAACGGDIVGTWTVQGACTIGSLATQTFGGSCPGATSSSAGTASGTITFNADMTYTAKITESGSETLEIPSSCTMGASCSELQAAFQQTAAADGDAGLSLTGTCTTVSSGCSCTISVPSTTDDESGTYSVSGDSLTLNTSQGTSSANIGSGTYCVQGNTLHLISVSSSAGIGTPDASTMPTADIVATK